MLWFEDDWGRTHFVACLGIIECVSGTLPWTIACIFGQSGTESINFEFKITEELSSLIQYTVTQLTQSKCQANKINLVI